MRQYSNGGVVIPTNENLDYTLPMNQLADTAQREVSKYAKIHSVYSFSRNPISPNFGDFSIYTIIPTDTLTDAIALNGQTYYFEVDSPCSVVIQESADQVTWSTLSTIVVTAITSFTAYSGNITPSLTTNYVRLNFSGTYPFNRRNTAIWDILFATIPVYSQKVKYSMPSDFYKLDKIVTKNDINVYEENVNYQWVGFKDLYVNYDYTGSFDVYYYKYPTRITDATSDSYVFEITDEAADAIPYYLAGMGLLDEMPSMAKVLLDEYKIQLANLETLETNSVVGINRISGW
jgi:hypothetical protein